MLLFRKTCHISELDHPCAHGEANTCWRDQKRYPDDICNYDLRCNGIDDYTNCLFGNIELKKYDENECSGIFVIRSALMAFSYEQKDFTYLTSFYSFKLTQHAAKEYR